MAKPIEYLRDARIDFDESLTGMRHGASVPQLDLLPPSTTRWTGYLTTPADFHQLTAAALIAPLNGIPFEPMR